ncbi:MAG: hypothetical protein HY434_00950 [Candidatus Liptonbacteria bacterium]|nr:hypothetical protein [Candidatus Liptonbacteria bacterium]
MYEIATFVLFLAFAASVCVGRWSEKLENRFVLFAVVLCGGFLSLLFLATSSPLDSHQEAVLLITALVGNFFPIAAGAIVGVAARNIAKLRDAQDQTKQKSVFPPRQGCL